MAAGACLAAAFFEWLCSFDGRGVVEGTVAEHREEHVTAAPGQGDQGLVVSFALGPFPVVVGPGEWVLERRECGEGGRPLRGLVALLGGVIAMDRSPGTLGHWCEPGVGSEVTGSLEFFARNLSDDACFSPDADRWH